MKKALCHIGVLFFMLVLSGCEKWNLPRDNPNHWLTPDNSKLPGMYVKAIAIDNEGNAWIGKGPDTGPGAWSYSSYITYDICRFKEKGNKFKKWDDLGSGGIYDIISLGNGDLWAASSAGLNRFDGKKWQGQDMDPPDFDVLSMAVDAQGIIWCGTDDNGVWKYDGTSWTGYDHTNSGLPVPGTIGVSINQYSINGIYIDDQNTKWFTTQGAGLVSFDDADWTVYNTSNSILNNNSLSAIAGDGNGNLWIGTSEGLAKFDGINWTIYNTTNSGLTHDHVLAVAVDKLNNVWIGAGGYYDPNSTYGSLAKFNEISWEVFTPMNSGLPGNVVFEIVVDNDGNIWFGTDGGVARAKAEVIPHPS